MIGRAICVLQNATGHALHRVRTSREVCRDRDTFQRSTESQFGFLKKSDSRDALRHAAEHGGHQAHLRACLASKTTPESPSRSILSKARPEATPYHDGAYASWRRVARRPHSRQPTAFLAAPAASRTARLRAGCCQAHSKRSASTCESVGQGQRASARVSRARTYSRISVALRRRRIHRDQSIGDCGNPHKHIESLVGRCASRPATRSRRRARRTPTAYKCFFPHPNFALSAARRARRFCFVRRAPPASSPLCCLRGVLERERKAEDFF